MITNNLMLLFAVFDTPVVPPVGRFNESTNNTNTGTARAKGSDRHRISFGDGKRRNQKIHSGQQIR